MFNFILSLFQKKYPTGLIPDPRSAEEKSQDYLHEEIAGASMPVYKNGMDNLNEYPAENQRYTSSCVAHGCTLSATKGSPRLSKMFVYRNRLNFPEQGMWLQNAGDILKNSGSCLYDSMANVETEDAANNIVIYQSQTNEALNHKIYNYVQIQSPDIDKIASVVAQGTPVAILIYASYKEWAKSYPSLEDNPAKEAAQVHHCIGAVDAFILNGVKYLKIQDSSWFGGMNVRYVSEAFVKSRCYGAIYFTSLSPSPSPKPDHIFNTDIQYGQHDQEVMFLQKRLMAEGTFPAIQAPTGYFGGITLKAVKDYQTIHSLPPTGYVGPLTRRVLNGG